MPDHPIQPLVKDEHGTVRFKENKIISAMLSVCDKHRLGLNEIVQGSWSRDDYDQLLQLIGYSVDGAPLSPACTARVPDLDEEARHEPTFTEGFRAGYEQARRDALNAIKDMEDS